MIEYQLKMSLSRVIYCFWPGLDEMSDRRKRCLEQLRHASECEVVLVTPRNLPSYILRSDPLHPGFMFLSEVHKADYLRTYFMHFHGGGYSDIKETTGSWKSCFDELETSDAYGCGYKEVIGGTANTVPPETWTVLIGNDSYIFKPRTPFTTEWYSRMMDKMNQHFTSLIFFPSRFSRDQLGSGSGYPLKWTEILGDIFHPVSLQHQDKLLRTQPPNIFENYQ